MTKELEILMGTAVMIACIHTISGPDHYLPFIALSKARGWSFGKTIFWTLICGCGHVWSSVILGLGGAAIGWSFSKISWLESVRGGFAAWFMLAFGLIYFVWGLYRISKNRVHKHFDTYESGEMYVFEHKHGEVVNAGERHKVTPWVMFIIFLLGPCEPMIPLLSFPAASNSWHGMLLLIVLYTAVTLLVMTAMVVAGFYGTGLLRFNGMERYMHVLGGLAILICGAGMVFIEW